MVIHQLQLVQPAILQTSRKIFFAFMRIKFNSVSVIILSPDRISLSLVTYYRDEVMYYHNNETKIQENDNGDFRDWLIDEPEELKAFDEILTNNH